MEPGGQPWPALAWLACPVRLSLSSLSLSHVPISKSTFIFLSRRSRPTGLTAPRYCALLRGSSLFFANLAHVYCYSYPATRKKNQNHATLNDILYEYVCVLYILIYISKSFATSIHLPRQPDPRPTIDIPFCCTYSNSNPTALNVFTLSQSPGAYRQCCRVPLSLRYI